MTNFQSYIKSVRASGHYSFTVSDAMASLNVSHNAVLCGMYKLKKKGDIVSPAKNLYVIVPPEYQALGCLPADALIPILMQHWGLPYYVCLLSAALYHGASHQKPQVFQVMVSKQLKTVVCGKVKIEFIYKKSLDHLPTKNIPLRTGYLVVATAELIVMDLLLYLDRAGGINHVATILSELIEVIDPEKLITLLEGSNKKSCIQRLGYILEHIDSMEVEKQKKTIELLHQSVVNKTISPVALVPELPTKGKSRNHRWMIIENTTIESDL